MHEEKVCSYLDYPAESMALIMTPSRRAKVDSIKVILLK